MKKFLIAFAVLSFLSCSNDNSEAVRRVTFKANGVYKNFDDIRVTSAVDNSFDVPPCVDLHHDMDNAHY